VSLFLRERKRYFLTSHNPHPRIAILQPTTYPPSVSDSGKPTRSKESIIAIN
jgi:hypothetical protein